MPDLSDNIDKTKIQLDCEGSFVQKILSQKSRASLVIGVKLSGRVRPWLYR